jgi:hypothetical protein
MDKAQAIRGVRHYAKNAHTSYLGFADGLRKKLETNPNHVDSVMDFEKFMELRAVANIYSEKLSLDANGDSPFDDDKVLDRIEDQRKSLTDSLLGYTSQQSGMYAVHQHLTREAAKRFLTETQIIMLIEDPKQEEAVEALAWLRKGWDGDNSERAITALETLDNAGVFRELDEQTGGSDRV